MWNFLRRKLWTYDISAQIQELEQQIVDLKAYHASIAHQVNGIDGRLRVQSEALGKILVQLQPMLAKPDVPPTRDEMRKNPKLAEAWNERQAESDRLGQEAIKRLQAEDRARRHSEGKC